VDPGIRQDDDINFSSMSFADLAVIPANAGIQFF
jgi:hypothetical protein